MIDLHCHILPGIDDGPSTFEESLAMARASVRDGVQTIVATPHGVEWGYTGGVAETGERVAALQAELVREGVGLELLPGLEVYLTPDSPTDHARGRIFTLNASRYMLVEFPLQMLPPYAAETLFQLQLRQVVPIVAHPERNADMAADLKTVERMVERGMLVQVTAASLVGSFGSRTREAAERLVARGLAHVIASDAHSTGGRSPVLSEAVRRAAGLVGEEAARAMVTTIPAAILTDEDVKLPAPQPARHRSWFPFRR